MAKKDSPEQIKGMQIMKAVQKIMDAERAAMKKEEEEQRKREARASK